MRSRFRAAMAAPVVAAAAAAVVVSLSADTTVASNAAPTIPTPESAFGFTPCQDYKLANYTQISSYFHQLDNASDRMQVVSLGQTSEGRDQIMGIVSAPENLTPGEPRQVPGHRQPARPRARADGRPGARPRQAGQGDRLDRLRHPLDRGRAAADRAAVRLRPADVQHARDEVDPQERHHAVRPEHQPGRRRAHPGLVHEVRRDPVPGLELSRALPEVLRARRQPRLVHVQPAGDAQPGQRAVALVVSAAGLQHAPDRGLSGAHLPAAVQGSDEPEHPARGHARDQLPGRRDDPAAGPRGQGRRRVSRQQYDQWWNGGLRSLPAFHNQIGILSETSHASATPVYEDPTKFPKTFPYQEVSTSEPSAFYPSPYKGGMWHLSDSCSYIESTALGAPAHRRRRP